MGVSARPVRRCGKLWWWPAAVHEFAVGGTDDHAMTDGDREDRGAPVGPYNYLILKRENASALVVVGLLFQSFRSRGSVPLC